MKLPAHIVVQLIHIHGSLKGEIQEFADTPISIGRLPSSSVYFKENEKDLMVSRNHASIQREGNQFKLIDVSKFGTFVNGVQKKESYLKNGDVLEFGPGGPKVSFQTEIREGEAEPVKPALTQPEPPPVRSVEPPSVVSFAQPPVIEEPQIIPLQAALSLEERPLRSEAKVQAPSPQKVSAPLIIQFGPTIRTYKELPVVLGTHSRCDFVLAHDGICEQHAQIFYSLDSYWIKDLTGQNMIRINQDRIDFQAQLQPMDEIKCSPQGPVFKFLGDGRLAEIEEIKDEPLGTGGTYDNSGNNSSQSAKPEEGNFFSKIMKGFKK